MAKLNKVRQQTVILYGPNDEKLGNVNCEDFSDFRAQIAEENPDITREEARQSSGYKVKYKNQFYNIAKSGECNSLYGTGIWSREMKNFSRIIAARRLQRYGETE